MNNKTIDSEELLRLTKHEARVILQAIAENHNLYISMLESNETVRNYTEKDMETAINNRRTVYEKWLSILDLEEENKELSGLTLKPFYKNKGK